MIWRGKLKKKSNIRALQQMVNNVDPTRTLTLRNAFIADATRRFRALQRVITESVVDRDIFQLGSPNIIGRNLEPANPNTFAMLTKAEQVQAFNEWLEEQEAAGILEVMPGPGATEGAWSDQYIRSSYQKGLDKSLRELRAKGIDVPVTTVPGVGGVGGVFLSPFHQERVQVLYTETFTALENVTAAMNEQIRRQLAQGIAEGIGPEEMARRINDRVDKIGLTRAKTIARTEVVKTYNTAQVFEYQRVENIIGEEVFVQWEDADDERVRDSHEERDGNIYTKEEYLMLIGEPNCRCTGLPYIESLDGEAELTSAAETRDAEAKQAAKEKEEAAKRREERRRQRMAA
jgi:SPP1 gp7 family putative phage head morphogenesis protein